MIPAKDKLKPEHEYLAPEVLGESELETTIVVESPNSAINDKESDSSNQSSWTKTEPNKPVVESASKPVMVRRS